MHLREYLRPPIGRTISDTDFARQIGKPVSVVNRWANGLAMPKPDNLKLITEATGGLVTADDMLAGLVGRVNGRAA